MPNLSDADFVPVERMLAVGVFDTVSSMGIPRPVVGGLDFVIANTDLSTKVLNGYHALSADEDRATFFSTYWTPRHNVSQVIFPIRTWVPDMRKPAYRIARYSGC